MRLGSKDRFVSGLGFSRAAGVVLRRAASAAVMAAAKADFRFAIVSARLKPRIDTNPEIISGKTVNLGIILKPLPKLVG
jgi:hypothetical protein